MYVCVPLVYSAQRPKNSIDLLGLETIVSELLLEEHPVSQPREPSLQPSFEKHFIMKPGVMNAFNLSTWEAEADGPVQSCLHNETLSQRKTKEKISFMHVSLYVGMCT